MGTLITRPGYIHRTLFQIKNKRLPSLEKRVSFRDGHPWPLARQSIHGREPLKETLFSNEGPVFNREKKLSTQTGRAHLIPVWFLLIFLVSFQAEGKLNVLTTTTNIKSLVESIAGNRVNLESILKGPQDPHFLEAKPSYMLKARKADLLILAGMELEIGWLPNIIQGARNPHIQPGQAGYLDTSQFIQALSVPEGKVDRFFGDIHPFGNPHFFLDPLRAVQVSKGISQKLSELDPENKDHYIKNQKQFEENIQKKMKEWRQKILNSGVKKLVTYHGSFEYFIDQFQLDLVGLIEEKPGIPPSAKHVLNLMGKIRASQSSCVLVSSFYSNQWAEKIKEAVPVHIESVAIEVRALEGVTDYVSLIWGIVQAIENCGQFSKNQQGEEKG